jgi:hypothetical protein
VVYSEFWLNVEAREARRDLSSPYQMHRSVGRLVDGGKVLWRQEGKKLLLLSTRAPQWELLKEDYLARLPLSRPYPVDRMELLNRRLFFRLRANPIKNPEEHCRPGKANSAGGGGREVELA